MVHGIDPVWSVAEHVTIREKAINSILGHLSKAFRGKPAAGTRILRLETGKYGVELGLLNWDREEYPVLLYFGGMGIPVW